ncbi:BPT1 [[Candida] subhashii]|uniref:BPT1 n=1 Tax=[Candida] subhashii TaxID=561895 RepID=A0A8J5QH51_9ASCO|nr:BPT1 [[Candida] subhashii]KAG7662008.1 BPT1 [[Candida] subhashii]
MNQPSLSQQELVSGFSPANFLSLTKFSNNFSIESHQEFTTNNLTIPYPLYPPTKNALNPEFVQLVGLGINLVFALFIGYQIFQFYITPKKHVIFTATPFLQTLKTFLVGLQVILVAGLWKICDNVYFLKIGIVIVLALVLHCMEFRRSAVPSASLLLYWLVSILFGFGILLQDTFSKHKIFVSDNSLSYVVELLSMMNNFIIFVLELAYYVPGFETDNEKFMDTVNLFSYLTFYYLQPLIDKIYATNDVSITDLPDILDDLSCDDTSQILVKEWDVEKKNAKNKSWTLAIWGFITRKKYGNKPSLLKVVLSSFSKYLYASLSLEILESVITFSQPFVLRKFIQFFSAYYYATPESPAPPIIIGYSWALLMFALACAYFITFNQSFSCQFNLSYAISSSLTTVIYEKALRLSPQARKNKPTGDIINHITMDLDVIFWFCWSLGNYLSGPLRLIVCLFALNSFFGKATWAGVLTAVIVIPFATYVNSSMYKYYNQLMKDKDTRTSLITELLNSAKNVKLYSWEGPMLSRLSKIRNEGELKNLKQVGVVSALASFFWSCIPFFISCSTFAAFAYWNNVALTPDIMFPALSLFDLLSEPMLLIPDFIVNAIETYTSLRRIGEMLMLDELDEDQNGYIMRYPEPAEPEESASSVVISNSTFVWNSKEPTTTVETPYRDEETEIEASTDPKSNIALSNINFVAETGKLTCIVGKVGSGKSTLIKAILGDIPLQPHQYSDSDFSTTSPKIKTYGSIAYYGDATIVGEKGIALSGGQKARISLARAVYARTDIYLLDDVLAAVDVHVGKKLVEKVIGKKGIIGDRTIVLATNSVTVLTEAEEIYLMSGGRIEERGKYVDVMESGGALAELIKEYGKREAEEEEKVKVEEEGDAEIVESAVVEDAEDGEEEEIGEYLGEGAEQKDLDRKLRRASVASYAHTYDDLDDDDTPRKTAHDIETTRKGSVPWEVFKQYIVACDYKFFSIYLGCTLATLLVSVGEKYLLTYWSRLNQEHNSTVDAGLFLGIYSSLGVVSGFLTYLGALIMWSYCIVKGAAYFHDKMAKAVFRSPMSFFDTTPVGRILNRFTEDIGKIDMNFPWVLIGFTTTLLSGIITFGVIVSTLPIMFFVISVLMFIYNHFRIKFIPTTRELKRIESVAKSPVLATIQETINGVDTIKAFKQRDRFVHKSKKFINDKTLIGLVIQNGNRWLSVRLQTISSSIMFMCATLAVVSLTGANPISPSVLGFIMTYALSITHILNALVRYWAEIQSGGVAVERLIEYCELPSEAEMIIEDNRPDKDWPNQGVIKFKNYSTSYRAHLDPVLKNIELTITSKEKVGIVGRTGAGKSSLTLALFRIIEATEGHIEIDGIDTSKIGLYDLRHHLTIIPQEAHTFRASVRENLDPFGEYTDEKLWKALELAHLKEHVLKMETDPTEAEKKKSKNPGELPKKVGLDAQIEEGGSNLSAGQKQLLCLARALLNETSKILVLDEATAAVDFQTDKIIQETIRSSFKDKTILTIAHRIDTILDSDKILVLDHGEVAEFDTPENLLKNTESIFYSLAKEGGFIN